MVKKHHKKTTNFPSIYVGTNPYQNRIKTGTESPLYIKVRGGKVTYPSKFSIQVSDHVGLDNACPVREERPETLAAEAYRPLISFDGLVLPQALEGYAMAFPGLYDGSVLQDGNLIHGHVEHVMHPDQLAEV